VICKVANQKENLVEFSAGVAEARAQFSRGEAVPHEEAMRLIRLRLQKSARSIENDSSYDDVENDSEALSLESLRRLESE
jgi:hypothetical protein